MVLEPNVAEPPKLGTCLLGAPNEVMAGTVIPPKPTFTVVPEGTKPKPIVDLGAEVGGAVVSDAGAWVAVSHFGFIPGYAGVVEFST